MIVPPPSLRAVFRAQKTEKQFFLIGIQVQPTGAMNGHGGKPPRAETKEAAIREPMARMAGKTPALHFRCCAKNRERGRLARFTGFFCGRAFSG
jgi:hypothetical protein